MQKNQRALRSGFTIVELLVVIVVIAILAAITVVSYNGITNQAQKTAIIASVRQGATQLATYTLQNNTTPIACSAAGVTVNPEHTLNCSISSSGAFCISVSKGAISYRADDTSLSPVEGECPKGPATAGDIMQTITADRCPTSRTMVVDARDNHTYWIQKMPDGKCWMLTNLAYSGGTSNGGVATYGDVVSGLINASSDPAGTTSYTKPNYYTYLDSNPTVNPALPSAHTSGGGSREDGGRQYGYYYNWCAALAIQPEACAIGAAPVPTTRSVCPAGWRLPTGEVGTGELGVLVDSLGGSTGSEQSLSLRSVWLAQFGGSRDASNFEFNGIGGAAVYWSSTSTSNAGASGLFFNSSYLNKTGNGETKNEGNSVRCVSS